jgi:DNA-binding MarR family transcriptional regulator
MHEPTTKEYDVFISYSHADRAWVWNELLPRLERAGLRVCIDDRNFEIGRHKLVNIERAVEDSRHTLIVLTPAWIVNEWSEFEGLLTSGADPAARRRKLLPLKLKPCKLPPHISLLTCADFTQPHERACQFRRLLEQLQRTSVMTDSSDRSHIISSAASVKHRYIRHRILELLYETCKNATHNYLSFDMLVERIKTCPEVTQFHLDYLEKQGHVTLKRIARGVQIIRYYTITPKGIETFEQELI